MGMKDFGIDLNKPVDVLVQIASLQVFFPNRKRMFDNGDDFISEATSPLAMKIISWNCHELGSPRAVRAFKRMVRTCSPHIIFLQETRLRQIEMEKINCFEI